MLRRQAANCHIMSESHLLAKHAEAGPCGLTTKDIHNTCQEKPGWVSKELNNEQKEKPLKSLLFHQGEKPRGVPQGGIKHQNNARASLGTMCHNFFKLFNPSICHFILDQSMYIESQKAKRYCNLSCCLSMTQANYISLLLP